MAGTAAGFTRRCREPFYLLLFASMLSVSLSVLSVAPDDFDSGCIEFAQMAGDFQETLNNPNEKVLLDTQFYPSQNLLTISGEDKLWISLDLDMSTSGTGTNQWIDQSQSATCQHELFVCGYMTGDQNNWMITQYINISRTGVIELLLNASFTGASSAACSGNCRESVRVRIFETNEPDEIGRNGTSSYGGIVASLEHIQQEVIIQKVELQPITISESSTGLYLAVVDPSPGTCISIDRLALFYYVCPEQVVNLVKYPETLSPTLTSNFDVFLNATCVDNAVLTSIEDELECSRRGNWDMNDATCSCMEGYYFSNESCKACYPGSYKDVVGNGNCSMCPAKSNSTQPGAAVCNCSLGYYRAKDETAADPCTAPPGPPLNLQAVGITVDSISLKWDPPTDKGGRMDLHYTIRYTPDQGESKDVPNIMGTTYTLMGLMSAVKYTVSVIANNGVSNNADVAGRTITTTFTTSAIGASAPESVELSGDVLSWRPPTDILGTLTKYQIMFTVFSTTVVTRNVMLFNVSSSETSADLHDFGVPTGNYLVQVRAVTTVGLGLLSEGIPYTEDHVAESSSGSVVGLAVGIVIVIVVCALAVVILIAVILLVRRRNSKATRDLLQPSEPTDEKGQCIEIPNVGDRTTPPRNRMYVDPRTYASLTDAMHQVRVREIPPKELANLDEIGVGEFGLVYKATLISRNIAVAVKVLKGGATFEQKENFLMEASVMGQFNHPNVVRLCGVISRVDPVMIVMEYLENGSLDRYLKKNLDRLSRERQLKIASGVASGMSYLSEVSFVHRDLAARNILVGKDEVCKVADFGLAREMKDNEYGVNRGGRIPVRWTAPEAIAYRSFTVASDVWSFGVLLWEIMTYGQTPYETMDNHTLLDQLEKGMRLEQPLNCPDEVYQLMRMCWEVERTERPTFTQLEDMLSKMISGSSANTTPCHTSPSADLKLPIERWLKDIQMERYCDYFINQGLRKLGDILELSRDDLVEMGITLAGHQHKILKNIHIKQEELGRE